MSAGAALGASVALCALLAPRAADALRSVAGALAEGLAWFLTPEPVLLERGEGFATFGPQHLSVLACCLAAFLLLVRRYLRLPAGLALGSPRRRMLLATSVVPLALLASRDVVLAAEGLLVPIFWPLHVCNLCEYLAIAYALACDSRAGEPVGEVLFTWGATGGLSALLFPGWSYCPILSYASLGGFAEHTLLLVSAWAPVAGGDFSPSVRRSWIPALAALLAGALFRLTNPDFGTNFFFVTQPLANTPFELFADLLGNPGFLVPYALGAYGVWLAWYALAARLPLAYHADRASGRQG